MMVEMQVRMNFDITQRAKTFCFTRETNCFYMETRSF